MCKYLLSELIGAPPAVHPEVHPKGARRSLKLKHNNHNTLAISNRYLVLVTLYYYYFMQRITVLCSSLLSLMNESVYLRAAAAIVRVAASASDSHSLAGIQYINQTF
jgi:hypothetical protein